MVDFSGRLRLAALQNRSAVFRWLWVHHDEVAAYVAEKHSRTWSVLVRLAQQQGVPVTRSAMRMSWKTVDDEWGKASSELRSAVLWSPPAEIVSPAKDQRAPLGRAAPAIFSEPAVSQPGVGDDEFIVTDITGKRIN